MAILTLLAIPGAGVAATASPAPPPTCASAEALEKAGETDAAKRVFTRVLLVEPGSKCALEGLQAQATEAKEAAPSECAKGKAFEVRERWADAEAAYKKALESKPSAECAKNGLKLAEEENDPNWFDATVDEIAAVVVDVLLVLGVLLMAWFLIALLGHIRPIGRWLRGHWPYRSLLAPRSKIEAPDDTSVDGKAAAAFTARLKQRMRRMQAEADDLETATDLDFGTPTEEFTDIVSDGDSLKTSLEAASDISDQTKLVAGLLGLFYSVLPIPRLTISGAIEPPKEKAPPAVTMVLEEDSRLKAAVVLQGATPDVNTPAAADFLTLAEPAAVWVQYEVAKLLSGEEPRLDGAEAWAVVKEGLDAYRGGNKPEVARAAFERAVRLDPQSWAGYLGAALVEARQRPPQFEQAIRILQAALAEMKESASPKKPKGVRRIPDPTRARPYLGNPDYFRIGYQLLGQRQNLRLEKAAPGALAGDLDAGLSGREFLLDVDATIAWLAARRDRGWHFWVKELQKSEARLLGFLEETVRPCTILVEAASPQGDGGEAEAAAVRKLADEGKVSYRTLYNLACYEARPGAVDATKAVAYLKRALRKAHGSRRTDLLRWLKADPALKLVRADQGFKDLERMFGEPAA